MGGLGLLSWPGHEADNTMPTTRLAATTKDLHMIPDSPSVLMKRESGMSAADVATAGMPAPQCNFSSGRVLRAIALPSRSDEHTSELQSLMRISYAVFCLKKKKTITD